MLTKTCCSCKEEKLTDDFHKSNIKGDGFQSRCKECTKITNKLRYTRKPKKVHNKVCNHCKITFTTIEPRNTFCSDSCRTESRNLRIKTWSEENPDKVSKYKETYQEKNKDKIKQNYYDKNHSLDGYVQKMVGRTKKNNYKSDITQEFLKQLILENNERCKITNIPFEYENKYGTYHNPYAPSIDRIDSKKGYSKDNVQIVLRSINIFKNDLQEKDFKCLLEKVIECYGK